MLITLFNAPDGRLRMAELAEQVVLSASGVTHLVTRLERDGLVQRIVDEDDRRSFFAALTPAGQQRLRDSRPTHNEVVREHLHPAPDVERVVNDARRAVGEGPRHLRQDSSAATRNWK